MKRITLTPRSNWSARMAAVRERHKWTQGELAAYLGCDQSEVSRWQRGAGCGVLHIGRLLGLALKLPTPLVTACAAAAAPAEPEAVVRRVLGGQAWRVLADEGPRPSRTLGRLAVVLALCAWAAPEALED